VMSGFMCEVEEHKPVKFVVAPAMLVAAALLAAAGPVRNAIQLEPVEELRRARPAVAERSRFG
jgi:hypothetical protein